MNRIAQRERARAYKHTHTDGVHHSLHPISECPLERQHKTTRIALHVHVAKAVVVRSVECANAPVFQRSSIRSVADHVGYLVVHDLNVPGVQCSEPTPPVARLAIQHVYIRITWVAGAPPAYPVAGEASEPNAVHPKRIPGSFHNLIVRHCSVACLEEPETAAMPNTLAVINYGIVADGVTKVDV